ncbi:hypothetical protein AAE478_003406 [Parahypoxylon ruwenzoriense]
MSTNSGKDSQSSGSRDDPQNSIPVTPEKRILTEAPRPLTPSKTVAYQMDKGGRFHRPPENVSANVHYEKRFGKPPPFKLEEEAEEGLTQGQGDTNEPHEPGELGKSGSHSDGFERSSSPSGTGNEAIADNKHGGNEADNAANKTNTSGRDDVANNGNPEKAGIAGGFVESASTPSARFCGMSNLRIAATGSLAMPEPSTRNPSKVISEYSKNDFLGARERID